MAQVALLAFALARLARGDTCEHPWLLAAVLAIVAARAGPRATAFGPS
ncbi:hypothetical protein ACGF5T_32410 [Streptomyces sp. NPDC047853]